MSEHCYICKRKYDFVYSVPDEVWEKISPVPVDGFKSGGLLCIECANTRADKHGIILFWSAGVNGYPDAELEARCAKYKATIAEALADQKERNLKEPSGFGMAQILKKALTEGGEHG